MKYNLKQLCMMSNHISEHDIEKLTHIIDPRELCYYKLDGLAKDGKLFDYLMRRPVFRKIDIIFYLELRLSRNERRYIVNKLVNFKELFLEKLENLYKNGKYKQLYSLICPKIFILGFNNNVWLSRYDQFYESNSELNYIIDVVRLYNSIVDTKSKILYSCYAEYNKFATNTSNKGVVFFFSGVDFSINDDFSMFLSIHYVDFHVDRSRTGNPRCQYNCLSTFSKFKYIEL